MLGFKKNPFKSTKSKTSSTDALQSPTESQLSQQVTYHPDSHEEGGLLCNNDELLKQQREAITEWIKSMGKKILTGNLNLINTPFPVVMFEPRSYLEKLADVWVYPTFLSEAAATTDPLERMKLVLAWFIAGLHHGFEKWKKPFNPILGETWQAQLSDGTKMFIEQISHHPPISAFHMEGPGAAYKFIGLSQPHVSVMVKHYGFKTVAKGFRHIVFADGTRIELHYPHYVIKGVVYATRPRAEVEGEAVFIDHTNHLKAVLTFGPVKGSKDPVLRRSDAVVGAIYDCRDPALAQALDVPMSPNNQARVAENSSSGADDDVGSDEFESASETDWELRLPEEDVKDMDIAQVAAQVASSSKDPAISAVTMGISHVSSSSSMQQQSRAPMRSDSGCKALEQVSKEGKEANNSKGFFGGFSKMISNLAGEGTGSTAEQCSSLPVLARVHGSWLSHLSMDGKRYWSMATQRPDAWQPDPNPLPSDSRYRQDLAVLATGDLKGSQAWKEALENLQRNDKKMREQAIGKHTH